MRHSCETGYHHAERYSISEENPGSLGRSRLTTEEGVGNEWRADGDIESCNTYAVGACGALWVGIILARMVLRFRYTALFLATFLFMHGNVLWGRQRSTCRRLTWLGGRGMSDSV